MRVKLSTALTVVGLVLAAVLLWMLWNRTSIQALPRAGALPFFAAMALLPAIGVPITPFFLMAGAAFGTRLGILGSLVALGANASLCYWVARSGLSSTLVRLLDRLGYALPAVDEPARGVRFIIVVKLAPVLPVFAKNYLLGIVGAPFVPYLIASLAISGAYGVVILVFGESVLSHNVGPGLILAALLVLGPLGVWLWRRRQRPRSGELTTAS